MEGGGRRHAVAHWRCHDDPTPEPSMYSGAAGPGEMERYGPHRSWPVGSRSHRIDRKGTAPTSQGAESWMPGVPSRFPHAERSGHVVFARSLARVRPGVAPEGAGFCTHTRLLGYIYLYTQGGNPFLKKALVSPSPSTPVAREGLLTCTCCSGGGRQWHHISERTGRLDAG